MERVDKNQILYNILYILFKRKMTFTVVCISSFAIIAFLTFLKTPKFRATAKILIRPNPQQQLILFRDLATPGQPIPRVNPGSDLIQILTGREMAHEVVQKFELAERKRKKSEAPENLREKVKVFLLEILKYPTAIIGGLVDSEQKIADYTSRAIEDLIQEAQDIRLEEDTNVIRLCILEETPDLATNITNYMTQLLVERSSELEQMNASTAYGFTNEQVQAAEKALEKFEAELLEFRKAKNIISLNEQKTAKLEALKIAENQYIDVKTELSVSKARLEEMKIGILVQRKLLSGSPIIAENPVLRDLVNKSNRSEIQLAAQLQDYTESDTSVQKLRAEIEETQAKIAEELKVITESDSAILRSIHPDLSNEYFQVIVNVASLTAKKETLQNEIETLKTDAFNLSILQTELDRLNRAKETAENLYKKLLEKSTELGVQKSFHLSGYDLKIIDKAFVPEDAAPDDPRWIIAIPSAFIGSLLLSFLAVFFLEYWDESFKSAYEIEEKTGLPVLCTISKVSK